MDWYHCSRCNCAPVDPEVELVYFEDSTGTGHLFCEPCYDEYKLYLSIPCHSHKTR